MAYGKISAKQKEILEFIKDRILQRGFPPAVREICEAVHLKSTSSVHSHLETLEKNGYIRRDPTKPRAIEICDDSFRLIRSEVVSLPVVSKITAGMPVSAEENIEGYYPLPASVCPKGTAAFLLSIKDDSMVNAGIRAGDRVFVTESTTAENGDRVVAWIDDAVAVRTFFREDGHVRLQPENDHMEPVITDENQVLGRVFGVLRLYGL